MYVVVTGGAGVLGSRVAINLAAAGHQVRAADLRPVPPSVEQAAGVEGFKADLTSPDDCRAAVEGAEVVVHCASIHPWKDYPDSAYWDLNVKATHHLLAACVAAKVRKVVLTSSVEPFAGGPFTPEQLPVREDVIPAPRRLYGLTKQIGEEIAARFHRVDGLPCLVLRPATFIPYPEPQLGPRLLNGTWLYPEDVIAAHVMAVDAPLPPSGWAACYVAPEVPYSSADAAATRQGKEEALAVYERHFPGTRDVLARLGLDPLPLNIFYSVEQARRVLGWRPKYDFTHWLTIQQQATGDTPLPSYDRDRWLV
jgi:UDP-glucose 4-epimerase